MADNVDLEKRIAHLELVVSDLQKTLEKLTVPPRLDASDPELNVRPAVSPKLLQAPQDEVVFVSDVSDAQRKQRPALKIPNLVGVNREEFWLNRLGIGLLLLGVAFLFKYSIDQGWIIPEVRVGFGLGLGCVLFFLGWRLQQQRSALSQILIGGSIGTFYITGFAAYQLYQLLAYPAAFVWMVLVTLLAFVMSWRSSQAVLAVVGAIGGLGTPFLLYSDQGSPVTLVAYTCLILIGTSGIYFYKSWQSLLWTTYIGVGMIFGWSVISSVSLGGTDNYGKWLKVAIANPDLMGIQTGFLLGWVAFAIIPIASVLFQLKRSNSTPLAALRTPTIYAIAFLTPLGLLLATGTIWGLGRQLLGWLTVAAALLYGAGGSALRQRNQLKLLGNTHWLTAVVLFSLALPAIFQGHVLLMILALEALLVHTVARRTATPQLLVPAHLLSATVSCWILVRLDATVNVPMLFNPRALADLVAMGLLLLASLMIRAKSMARLYQLVVHFELLIWLWRELAAQGAGYVTVAWGIYAIGVLIVGLRQDWSALRWTGLATLLLAVSKLILYDLANVEALWRILLSLGFGAVFLGLSYALQVLWKPKASQDISERDA
ncbi:hypothetical protein C1752_06150 [Acaryochloris thomasi RCC1774]|uniref:DUF2339 domain-containing protein n=1 Tax=Acaryochloris thomasi RCC1774 TaxID=1764569 RepID=A0A2W1JBW5_9CYAN|nr:DUF2339 domain-containing protein [Acaryochloris thomasi]PZD71530.1 hypothetical protein C1752_06150 [Acaryochloris thomasi RCC1774]